MSPYPIEDSNLKDTEEIHDKNIEPMNSIIGKLRYLVDHTRPDLLYPVNLLSRFVTKSSKLTWDEVYRLLSYLKYTKSFELIIGGSDQIEIIAMSDA
jgi:hypothetical protein